MRSIWAAALFCRHAHKSPWRFARPALESPAETAGVVESEHKRDLRQAVTSTLQVRYRQFIARSVNQFSPACACLYLRHRNDISQLMLAVSHLRERHRFASVAGEGQEQGIPLPIALIRHADQGPNPDTRGLSQTMGRMRLPGHRVRTATGVMWRSESAIPSNNQIPCTRAPQAHSRVSMQ